jgi:hypothetical protein
MRTNAISMTLQVKGPGRSPGHGGGQDDAARTPEDRAELERGLEEFSLTCTDCGRKVHWVNGLGNGGSYAEPAPHGQPAL